MRVPRIPQPFDIYRRVSDGRLIVLGESDDRDLIYQPVMEEDGIRFAIERKTLGDPTMWEYVGSATAMPELIASLAKAEKLMMAFLTVCFTDGVQPRLPYGLADEVKEYIRSNADTLALLKARDPQAYREAERSRIPS